MTAVAVFPTFQAVCRKFGFKECKLDPSWHNRQYEIGISIAEGMSLKAKSLSF